MEIKLDKLKIENFGGIKSQEFNFDGKDAKIYGDNATGKTTTALAMYWLLFDKGLEWETVDVVPVDENNQHIHELIPTVEASFKISEPGRGQGITFRRESHPNYKKIEGTNEKHYKNSRTTKQYIDDVPYPITKYKNEIADLIDEKVFKLITNTNVFPSLHWKEKRKVLFEIGGNLTDREVAESSEELKQLLDVIENRTIEDHKKVIDEKMKLSKKDLESIPIKINTLNDQMKDINLESSHEELEKEVSELEKQIDQKREEIVDYRNGGASLKVKREISDKDHEMDRLRANIESDSRDRLSGLKRNVLSLESDRDILESQKNRIKDELEKLKRSREDALAEYRRLMDERKEVELDEFKESIDDKCPTCSQPLPDDEVEAAKEKALENFNLKKANRLESIDQSINQRIQSGKKLAESITKTETKITETDKKIEKTENDIRIARGQIEDLEKNVVKVEDKKEWQDLQAEKKELEEKLKDIENESRQNVSRLNDEIDKLKEERNYKQSLMMSHEAMTDLKKAIENYKEQESELLDKMEQYQYEKYLIDQFARTKVKLITERVNSLFDLARFKLFKENITNGEIKETCEIMVDGVTYDGGLNNGMRINVGLDIIQTLGKHYDVFAPIFVDNAEAVTDLKKTDAQQIELIVSEQDKELRMEEEEYAI